MAKLNQLEDVVLLFENYNADSKRLHTSFRLAGFECPAIVINEDGFLPDDVISVYGYYLGDYEEAEGIPGKPLYFNQVTVPDYWEISGKNTGGKIMDLSKERGRISYAEPKHKRLVKAVDWLDEKGNIRFTDHYNRFGALYARTVFDAKQKMIHKSYFSPAGEEIIVENFVTGDIILHDEGIVKIFHGRSKFIAQFLMDQELVNCRFFYNTLSVPFFVSEALPYAGRKGDVLFWQEDTGNEVPGNMQHILDGKAVRTEKIVVQKRLSYEALIKAGADRDKLILLGYIYPFRRKNGHGKNILIATNSDNIEKLGYLIDVLSDMTFCILALTDMSEKLMEKESRKNVLLYPNSDQKKFEELLKVCDFYLDINHENEILSAVGEAFMNNLLIMGFEETVHNRDYIADGYLLPAENVRKLAEEIRRCVLNGTYMDKKLEKQRAAGLAEKNYAGLLKL